jgi:hypothetical protein
LQAILVNQVNKAIPSRRSLIVLLSPDAQLSPKESKKTKAFILAPVAMKALLLKWSNINYSVK